MTRGTWLLISVLILGCGGGNRDDPFTPPAALTAAATLEGFENLPVEDAPENVRSMGLERAYHARYSGEYAVTVEYYRMKTGASAFELVQKWRPAAGKLALYSGPWFVVIESPGAGHDTLSAIAGELETALSR